MRFFGATAGLGMVLGCTTSPVFICTNDGECEGGRCEFIGYCSFPNQACPEGWAYGELSAPNVAGQCVGEIIPPETGGQSTGPGPTSDSTDPSASVTSLPTSADDSDTSDSSTSYSDTRYGYETSYETGYSPYSCVELSMLLAQCYGPEYGDDGLYNCTNSYYSYLDYQGYDCAYAFLDFMSCISSLDCRQLVDSPMYCQRQESTFATQCNGDE